VRLARTSHVITKFYHSKTGEPYGSLFRLFTLANNQAHSVTGRLPLECPKGISI
jgi:hypothetical protein